MRLLWPWSTGTSSLRSDSTPLHEDSETTYCILPAEHRRDDDGDPVYEVVETVTRTRTAYVASNTPPSKGRRFTEELKKLFRKIDEEMPVSLHHSSTSKPQANTSTAVPGPPPRPIRVPVATSRRQIKFYDRHAPHFNFTNFSEHSVWYLGRTWKSSEHLFQAFKFFGVRDDIAEYIHLHCRKPRDALDIARTNSAFRRKDWEKVSVNVMDVVLYYKFDQHKELAVELLATGEDELVEDSPIDSFWGCGSDGRGRNELGKALERLREKLRS